jgi:outer membrane immunogenic protein
MKKHVFGTAALFAAVAGGPAFAADLPAAPQVYAPAPAPPPPPRFSWTGCYLGIDGGGAFGRARPVAATSPNPAFVGLPITNPFDVSGGVFGGEVGCNYQISAVVIGVANDFSWTNISGSGSDIPPFAVGAQNTVSQNWLDTTRGRVGFAWERFLIYGTGGAAFASVGINVCGAVVPICVSDSQVRTGWTAGAGVEWAAWPVSGGNLTFRIEYLHVDLGNDVLISPPVTIGPTVFNSRNVRLTDEILRGGVSWKFDWW